jgi:rhodanese-related sulfurtransferase
MTCIGNAFRGCLAVLGVVGALSTALAEPGIQSVSPGELEGLMRRGVMVIDVRRADEWRTTGVVPGSRTLTAFDAQGNLDPRFIEALSAPAEPDREIALICRTGNRSAKAARLLASELGYTRVSNVEGGMVEWLREGRPVVPCPSC